MEKLINELLQEKEKKKKVALSCFAILTYQP